MFYLLFLVASNDLDVLPCFACILQLQLPNPSPTCHVSTCLYITLSSTRHAVFMSPRVVSRFLTKLTCASAINYSAAITSARHSHTLSLQIFFPSLQIFLPSHSADIYISALQVRAFEWLKLKLIFRK